MAFSATNALKGIGGGTGSITSGQKNLIQSVGSAGQNLANTVNSGIQNAINTKNLTASLANGVSAQAQAAQGSFNQSSADAANAITEKWLNQQMEFNSKQAAEANALTERLQKEAMQYNASEAEKNRLWQTEMSNTAVQRQVKDMIKAGINPILAAQYGGAATGSGASASVGGGSGTAASIGAPSAQAASVGNYAGQFSNISDSLAIMGALASTFGTAMSALTAWGDRGSAQSFGEMAAGVVSKVANSVKKTTKAAATGIVPSEITKGATLGGLGTILKYRK